jgi:hypothetical protein
MVALMRLRLTTEQSDATGSGSAIRKFVLHRETRLVDGLGQVKATAASRKRPGDQ